MQRFFEHSAGADHVTIAKLGRKQHGLVDLLRSERSGHPSPF
jgi:hypothetical protein